MTEAKSSSAVRVREICATSVEGQRCDVQSPRERFQQGMPPIGKVRKALLDLVCNNGVTAVLIADP